MPPQLREIGFHVENHAYMGTQSSVILRTTSCTDPILTLYQEDIHLDTNMGDQLYMGTQLFIYKTQYSCTLYVATLP